jgi:acetylornithine/succinyldiaminopimelate/putrescine aminotransferase
LNGVAGVTEVRGMGMMIGVELDRPCGEIVTTALARGLIVNAKVRLRASSGQGKPHVDRRSKPR